MPLVYGDWCAGYLPQELAVRRVLSEQAGEFRRARTLLACGQQQNFSTGLDDVRRRRHTLDRLVKGEVQRITGCGCDYGIYRFGKLLQHDIRNKLDSAAVGRDGIAGEDTANRPDRI